MNCPHCNEPIDEHEASPCLNKWVAIDVMGHEFFEVGYFGDETETKRQVELEDWMDEVGIGSIGNYFIDVEENYWIECDDYQPSADISAAWEVVEKHDGTVLIGKHPHLKSLWYVDVMKSGRAHRGRGETAPLAICRAAIKAIGREEEDDV